MNKQPRILMLGGSAQQCPVITRAKEMGIYTVLCDYLPDNPGRLIADKYYPVSTTDVEAVYQVAMNEKVDGILAYASDPAALPAAIVCERLGLPTNPVSAVETLSLKHKFRQFQKEHGFPHPNFVAFRVDETPDLSSLKFPIIVKPTDSSGSKGVTKVSTPDELPIAIATATPFSRNRILIAEEYLYAEDNDLILGVELFVNNGTITLYAPMESIRHEISDSLVPMGEILPANIPEILYSTILDELHTIVDRLGIDSGEINVEVLTNNNTGKHCILDIGARAGGNLIPELVSMAYYVDLIHANIQAALGEDLEFSPTEPQRFYMYHVLYSPTLGIYKGLEIKESTKKRIQHINIYSRAGDIVNRFTVSSDAIGIAFFNSENREELENTGANIDKFVKVIIEPLNIEYKVNEATQAELKAFMRLTAPQFRDTYLQRIKQGYAEKLFRFSTRFEAWQGDKLVGIVCAYLNTTTRVAYVPHVCTIKEMQRMGICRKLLYKVEDTANSMGLKSIELEVYRDNNPAISVYTRFGMSVVEGLSTEEKLYMRKSL